MNAPNQSIRQGLPRVAGGDPWPPAELFAPAAGAAVPAGPSAVEDAAEPVLDQPVGPSVPAEPTPAQAPASSAASAPAAEPVADQGAVAGLLRQGLPRVAGGGPWPPAGTPVAANAPAASQNASAAPAPEPVAELVGEPVVAPVAESAPAAPEPVATAGTAPAAAVSSAGAPAVRRGLPRTAGAEPWPPSSFVAAPVAAAAAAAPAAPAAAAAATAAAPALPPAPIAEAAQAA
ncbi:cytochrome b/b6 domain-containing protein, partial [Micrococcus antarcticus]